MTAWLATGSHCCSLGTAGTSSVHAGTHGSSPRAGESKDRAGGSVPWGPAFPRGLGHGWARGFPADV